MSIQPADPVTIAFSPWGTWFSPGRTQPYGTTDGNGVQCSGKPDAACLDGSVALCACGRSITMLIAQQDGAHVVTCPCGWRCWRIDVQDCEETR